MRLLIFGVALWLGLGSAPAQAARVKDIADVYGVRSNMVSGVGLVTGLNRTGDSMRSEATIQTLAKRLQNQGITLTLDQISSRNVAVVMVNARIPASARAGQRLDVEVSSIGDATSLEGGVLQMTVLLAPNRQAYGVAQGPLVIGGYNVEQAGNVTRKNHPTVGRVPMGGVVERENENRLLVNQLDQVEWLLKQPDFTTARRFAEQVNTQLGEGLAIPLDEGTISIKVPDEHRGRTVDFIALIEALDVAIDAPARVLINEKTGTVVMGADVKIAPVAVAHGGLSIEVKRNVEASQPGALATGGSTTLVSNSAIQASEVEGRLTIIEGVTIGELVAALNKMGVKPRDLIQILIAIQAAGALHAELEVL